MSKPCGRWWNRHRWMRKYGELEGYELVHAIPGTAPALGVFRKLKTLVCVKCGEKRRVSYSDTYNEVREM